MDGFSPGKRLADHELRHRLFTVDDPELLRNLLVEIPEFSGPPEIEYAYDVTPKRGASRDYVYCAHCGYRTHWKGYVAKFGVDRCLIGKDCGFKLYGADFHVIERSFGEERRRQLLLNWLDSGVAAFPHLLRVLSEISIAHETALFDQARTMMRTKVPELWHRLGSISEGSGQLAIDEEIRDYEAERRRDEKRPPVDDAEEEDDPIFTYVTKVIGPLQGGAFCRPGLPDAADTFRSTHLRLKEEWRRLQRLDTDTLTTRQLSLTVNNLAADVEKLLALEAPMLALMSFFGAGNLARITEWANQMRGLGGKYEARAQRLLFTSTRHGETVDVRGPASFVAVDFTGIKAFLAKLRSASLMQKASERKDEQPIGAQI